MIKWLDPCRCPLPPEVVSRLPRVICYGNGKVLVEQHAGILVCLANEMAFQTVCGRLTIEGERLELLHYTDEYAIVLGIVRAIRYGGGIRSEKN